MDSLKQEMDTLRSSLETQQNQTSTLQKDISSLKGQLELSTALTKQQAEHLADTKRNETNLQDEVARLTSRVEEMTKLQNSQKRRSVGMMTTHNSTQTWSLKQERCCMIDKDTTTDDLEVETQTELETSSVKGEENVAAEEAEVKLVLDEVAREGETTEVEVEATESEVRKDEEPKVPCHEEQDSVQPVTVETPQTETPTVAENPEPAMTASTVEDSSGDVTIDNLEQARGAVHDAVERLVRLTRQTFHAADGMNVVQNYMPYSPPPHEQHQQFYQPTMHSNQYCGPPPNYFQDQYPYNYQPSPKFFTQQGPQQFVSPSPVPPSGMRPMQTQRTTSRSGAGPRGGRHP